MIQSLILLVLLLGYASANPIELNDKESIIEHLKTLGHVKKESETLKSVTSLETILKESLLKFQKFHRLKETGIFDKDTEKLMKTPRCGLPDERNPNLSQFKTKWAKNDLTYRVLNGYPGLDVNKIIAKAFSHWSSASSLTFRPSTSSTSDFNIMFASRGHNDDFPFDGKGGVLAHAFYPQDGKVHFDSEERYTEGRPDGTDLLMVAVHEIGHALGLEHNTYPGSIMNPYYTGYKANFQLPEIDRRDIAYMYGGPRPTQKTTVKTTTKTTTKSTSKKATTTTKKTSTTSKKATSTTKKTTSTTRRQSGATRCYQVCSTVCTPVM